MPLRSIRTPITTIIPVADDPQVRNRTYEILDLVCESDLRGFSLRSTLADAKDLHDRPNLLPGTVRPCQPRACAAAVSGTILEV